MPAILTGSDLTAWRDRLDWTVVHAAAELRIQPTSLRNLEAGRKAASGPLLRLAELLETLHTSPTSAPEPTPRPARRRKPKPEVLAPADAYHAAVSRARVGPLSPEAHRLLRAEVERQRRIGPWDPEPAGIRRERERAWEAVTEHAGSLWLAASVIALSMPRYGVARRGREPLVSQLR